MLIGGSPFAIVLPFSQCVVPSGINGPVAVFITSDQQPLANNVRDQATDKIIAGPTMAFIDTKPEMISQMVRNGSKNGQQGSAISSTSTQTITPAEASALISSASATATASASAATVAVNNAAGGPNGFTVTVGPITVQGWSTVPKATST